MLDVFGDINLAHRTGNSSVHRVGRVLTVSETFEKQLPVNRHTGPC